MKKPIVLFLFVFFNLASFAQEKEHPIDLRLKACLDSTQNQTTVGMIECEVKARDAWDGELNKYYKLLLTILSTDEKAKLKIAQKNWLVYRDSEFSFVSTAYYNLEGTMWKVSAAGRLEEIVRQRALELNIYYVTEKENEMK